MFVKATLMGFEDGVYLLRYFVDGAPHDVKYTPQNADEADALQKAVQAKQTFVKVELKNVPQIVRVVPF
jgi:hypothetical protein